jgi:hypothetical protein
MVRSTLEPRRVIMNVQEKGEIRHLTPVEIAAVTGGVVAGGCIVTKTIVPTVVSGDWVFVDQFASRLPSWVQPAPR